MQTFPSKQQDPVYKPSEIPRRLKEEKSRKSLWKYPLSSLAKVHWMVHVGSTFVLPISLVGCA